MRGSSGIHARVERMTVIERMKRDQDSEGLMEMLQKGAIYSKMRAADALGEIGRPAMPALIGAVGGSDLQLRWGAAIALGRMGDIAVDPLIALLATADPQAKVQITWALAEIGDLRAASPLIGLLQGTDPECCRVMAGAALLKLNDPGGVAAVKEECEKQGEEFAGMVSEAHFGT
jgi:HEAT repeat protein